MSRHVDLKSILPIGTRVRLSELGISRSPKMAGRTGTVVAYSPSGSGVRVVFDGFNSRSALHHTYVERLKE